MKSIVTEYTDICAICGKPRKEEHHLVFGAALRKLAEEDGLKIPICGSCHTRSIMAISRIHDNTMAENLSKMLGQMAFERRYIANKLVEISEAINLGQDVQSVENEAREAFRKRYGRSYL